jgi:hypothetical protein
MSEFMKGDKNLEKDINRATTFEDIRALLENAASRSGIADRDPQTGQFVRRDPLTPAAQTVPEEEKQINKTEVIGGKEITFAGTALEVEQQIGNAYKVAEALRPEVETPAPVVPRSARAKTPAESEQEVLDRTEAHLALIRGEITIEQYMDRTHAIDTYLAEKGFDVEAAGAQQFEQSWATATQEFLNNTPEGQSWKGGQKNLEIIGNLIQSHGLVDAQDKVAALRAMAAEMRAKGLEFDGDYTPQQVNEMTDKATPVEILEAWKAAQPDSETANAEFVRLHSGGRFFNK